ncbi:MAG: Smr/MutS family protein [Maricaulaceae bacterium]
MSRRLTPQDQALWSKIAKTIRPLPGKSPPPAAEPLPGPKDATSDTHHFKRFSAPAPKAADSLGAPADRGSERRLRRGRVEIDAKLDLHGLTQAEAKAALAHMLWRARRSGGQCVLVITGKGSKAQAREFGEPQRGVLREKLPQWLAEPEFRALVSGYAQAHQRHGGGGAFYVLLRRPRTG